MVVYRFPILAGSGTAGCGSPDPPAVVSVMHAGECLCDARLESEFYICELPDEYAAKLSNGVLDQVFVYEPPVLTGSPEGRDLRELVSILLVRSSRKGTQFDI